MLKVSVHIPETLLRMPEVQDNIVLFMKRKTGPEVRSLFKRTTEGWKHDVVFHQKNVRRVHSITEYIFPAGENASLYALVNAGAQPHDIPKTGLTLMKFRWAGKGSYVSSTRPRVLSSRRHYQNGSVITMSFVKHPGFEAREFDKTIAIQYRPKFVGDMSDAVGEVALRQARRNNALYTAWKAII